MTVYEIITERSVALLEAGTVPWRKPWNAQAGLPKNLASKQMSHPWTRNPEADVEAVYHGTMPLG
jgi:antirestriction protein ArdC